MNKNEKYTRVDKYTDIKNILSTVETDKYDISALMTFCDEQIASLQNKAAKAKAKAQEKKTERDELCEAVYAVLTTEPQTRDEIANQIEMEDASVAKVGARLTKLYNAGDIGKDDIKVDNGSGKKTTRMVYFLLPQE